MSDLPKEAKLNKEGKEIFIVSARSAGYHDGNYATITINDTPANISVNEKKHQRGIHLVVINPENGKAVHSRCFDTYTDSEDFEKFIKETDIPDGHIIVAALKDEGAKWMSDRVKNWFTSLGSGEIKRLQYQHAFCFIGIMGSTECNEERCRRNMR